jgi:hypothetical protein
MLEGDEKEKSAAEHSLITEATNYILLAAGVPHHFRPYIDCLIAVANGRFKFQASDKEIQAQAKFRRVEDNEKSKVNKQWAKDYRNNLYAWQVKNSFTLFDHKAGGIDKNNQKFKSTFTLYLPKYVEEVLDEAKKDILWGIRRSDAIKNAAQNLVSKFQAQPPLVTNKQSRKRIPPDRVETYLITVRTNLQMAEAIYKKWGDFKLQRDKEKLIDEIEKLLASIKARGFYDDPLDGYIFDLAENADDYKVAANRYDDTD